MSDNFRQHIMANDINNKIKEFLKQLGLDQKEISAYLYLLAHGPQNVSILAKSCRLTRTNGYDIVRKLEDKGLCYNLGSLYGRKIKANPASHIKEIILQKEKENDILKDSLGDILPLFKSLEVAKNNDVSQVSYFKGKESVRKMLLMTLQSADSVRFAGSQLDQIEALGAEFVSHLYLENKKRGIRSRVLLPENRRGQGEIFNDDKKYLREVRIRPKNLIRLKSNIFIWDKYVAFISLKENIFGTLIENEPLAVMLATWYDFIFDASERI